MMAGAATVPPIAEAGVGDAIGLQQLRPERGEDGERDLAVRRDVERAGVGQRAARRHRAQAAREAEPLHAHPPRLAPEQDGAAPLLSGEGHRHGVELRAAGGRTRVGDGNREIRGDRDLTIDLSQSGGCPATGKRPHPDTPGAGRHGERASRGEASRRRGRDLGLRKVGRRGQSAVAQGRASVPRPSASSATESSSVVTTAESTWTGSRLHTGMEPDAVTDIRPAAGFTAAGAQRSASGPTVTSSARSASATRPPSARRPFAVACTRASGKLSSAFTSPPAARRARNRGPARGPPCRPSRRSARGAVQRPRRARSARHAPAPFPPSARRSMLPATWPAPRDRDPAARPPCRPNPASSAHHGERRRHGPADELHAVAVKVKGSTDVLDDPVAYDEAGRIDRPVTRQAVGVPSVCAVTASCPRRASRQAARVRDPRDEG